MTINVPKISDSFRHNCARDVTSGQIIKDEQRKLTNTV